MVFSSLAFLCAFFPTVFVLHLILPSWKLKNALLIVSSLLFYAYGEPIYVVLMLVSSVFAGGAGVILGACRGAAARRVVLAVSLLVNLGMLGVFKYAGWLVESVNAVTGANVPNPGSALPIGISFYTFQALSYIIDVYRKDVEPQSSLPSVLLYISFFPQLIAGPIVKYHDVAGQLRRREVTLDGVATGLRRFAVGLGKKVLIANTMAITADAVFGADPSSVNVAVAWIGAIAYLLQIYFDFSGYSDMAIGMARMFGFHYQENFDHPYASASVKEFWRRWHISLSTWFKEYVYIPLGGNRISKGRTVFNKITVFFLCGLWHGANWTFVVWGLLHGLFLMLEEYLPVKRLPRPVGVLYTLLVVCLTFVIFRSETFGQAFFMLSQMVIGFHFEAEAVSFALRQLTPLFVGTVLVAAVASTPVAQALQRRLQTKPLAVQKAASCAGYVGALALIALSLLQLSGGGYNPFIYFRF